MVFAGFPVAAFDLYARLELDNSRAFWLANKAIYEDAVKHTIAELSEEVEGRFGALHLFRPYRDVRFAKDKTPYKTAAGAVTESEGGSSYYVQISAEGLFVGCGMYVMANDQLDRWRAALDDPRQGATIARAVERLRGDGYEIGAMQSLKTAPRGFPKDHPRIELLRMKGLTMGKTFPLAKWMHTTKAVDRVVAVWDAAKPMNTWLEKHVGPSTLAPSAPDF